MGRQICEEHGWIDESDPNEPWCPDCEVLKMPDNPTSVSYFYNSKEIERQFETLSQAVAHAKSLENNSIYGTVSVITTEVLMEFKGK